MHIHVTNPSLIRLLRCNLIKITVPQACQFVIIEQSDRYQQKMIFQIKFMVYDSKNETLNQHKKESPQKKSFWKRR